MTNVRLDVDTSALGDCTITRTNELAGFSAAAERAEIAELLSEAVLSTCRAFEIDPVAVTSRIESAGRRTNLP